MGWMTEISILNDCADQIKKHPKQFAEEVYKRIGSVDIYGEEFGLGYCANGFTVKETHHADDARLYLSEGNMFTDLTGDIKTLYKRNPELYRSLVKKAEAELKFIKRQLKEADEEN